VLSQGNGVMPRVTYLTPILPGWSVLLCHPVAKTLG